MRYYKFLTDQNKGGYSGFDYTDYLPKDGQPGEWLPEIENIEICRRGYHAFEPQQILGWLNAKLYVVELRGEEIKDKEKIVAQQIRFICQVDGWNDRTARLFACWCAREVLPIFTERYPADDRPRNAIETAERYAVGEATDVELAAARDAAEAALRAASWAAARDARDAASRAAARDANARYAMHLLEMLGIEGREVKINERT